MSDITMGVISGTQYENEGWNSRNNRRKIFHDYPGGEFPLTGLLSLMDPDWCDATNPAWHEKRWVDPETELAPGTTVPFTAAGSDTSLGAEVDFVAGQVIRIHVVDKAPFRERQVLRIENLAVTGGGHSDLVVNVESIVAGIEALEVRVIESVANVINSVVASPAGPVNAPLGIIGTANAEGSNSTGGIFIKPFEIFNYTQIFKNPFSVTGTSLAVPTDWDGRGTYPELAQDNLTRHMVDIEKAFFSGRRSIDFVLDDGEEVPIRTMGGVDWFLEQYEAADSPYRGGVGAPALTVNEDDEKRIIRSNAGSLTATEFFEVFIERGFRCTSNKGYEKLMLCGNGMLAAVNKYIKRYGSEVQKGMKAETVWGWNVYTVETPFGTIHFKSHPLFNRNPRRRFDGYLLDVHNLKYRPLNKRDTRKIKGVQPRGADKRKDVWETECTLEMRLPQSCMAFKNVQTITDT